MRKRALVAGLALAAGSLFIAAPAHAAATPSPGPYCKTSGIVGALDDPNAFFASQGGCASSLAQGAIVQTPFGPLPSVWTRAGYVSRCQQIVSTLGLSYPFTTPDGEFVNIQNLKQCADRLQQLHDGALGG